MRWNHQWLPDRSHVTGMLSRAAVQDVKGCLAWLEREEDEFKFRMVVIAAIALVRTVGHVLAKVDVERDVRLKSVVDQRYNTWKQNRRDSRIFWEFIDEERNLILKEYDIRIDFAPMVTTPEADHAWRIGSRFFCPLSEGAYAGRDVR